MYDTISSVFIVAHVDLFHECASGGEPSANRLIQDASVTRDRV